MHAPVADDTPVYRNALPVGSDVMEYRLEAVLGAGGFGITYLGWDLHLHKRVALKEYLPCDIALRALDGSIVPVGSERNEDYRWGLERFLQEARTLARFSHPHIVRVYRYFEANNTAYMVMDYEHGESLGRLLKREPYPPEERLRSILLPLLDGLHAVHEAGFLHRDIKPTNIFLREQGGPVLIDFGAARHTIGGSGNYTAVVTPGYAPIEQYSAESSQGPWSDVYAVAGVFYRAVTNEHPPDAVGRMRLDSVPEKLHGARDRYSAALLCAIGWGLETDEARRPQSVAEWQQGVLGERVVPYDLPEPVAGLVAGEEVPPLASAVPRLASPRYSAAYRWGVPAALVLGVVAWRAYESRTDPVDPTPVTTTSPATPAVPVTAKAASSETTVEEPAPRRKSPAARTAAPQRSAPAEQSRGAQRAATDNEHGRQTAAGEENRAPVRDAVALPPLRDVTRERPGRDRTPRPGFEP